MTTLTAAPPLTRTIHAPVDQIYKAFTETDWLHDWLCDDANVRTAVGGHLLLQWFPPRHAMGEFTALEPNQYVAFTLRYSDSAEAFHIEVTLKEANSQTEITLAGAGEMRDTWEDALSRLQEVLEVGSDPRITNRVLIGIYPGNLDEETAKKLNISVTDGTLVNDVIPGLGAARAGLQPQDVVVEIDGKPITRDNPIYERVRHKKPGDTVEVGYYRDGVKQTATMPLSGYPLPNFPADYPGLADQTEAQYADLDRELSALFEGISGAEAGHKVAPDEWSAYEVVAHLILHERWLQHWLGGMMQGPEVSGYTNNTPARIAGIVSVHKTDMLDEMRRSWAETVALLRSVPEAFFARKINLWWSTFEVDQSITHTRQHFGQIRRAIEASRQ